MSSANIPFIFIPKIEFKNQAGHQKNEKQN